MPAGTGVSGLESDGKDRLFCGGGKSGKPSWPKLAVDFLKTPRFDPLAMTNENKSVMAFNLSYLFDKPELLDEGMKAIFGWIASGELEPPTVTTFPFEKVADAHRAIESGETTGKLVLVV